jgi:radical SAM protein with 4Fe4S-binding SPASM domain
MYPTRKVNTELRINPKKGVIIYESGNKYSIVNSTGAQILEMCNGNNRIDDIIEKMAKMHDDNVDRIRIPIKRFIDTCENGGFIEIYSESCNNCGTSVGNSKCFVPVKASIELTMACDLRCRHCYAEAGLPMQNEMNTTDVLTVLKKLHDAGTRKLIFTGGDPLVRNDFFQILDYCKDRFLIQIFTNGYRLDAETCNKLAKYGNIQSIQISIDGPNAKSHEYIRVISGSFERAVNGAEMLSKKGVAIAIAMMVAPFNINQIENTLNLAISVGAKLFRVGKIALQGRAKDPNWELNGELFNFVEKKLDQFSAKYGDVIKIERWESQLLGENIHKETINCGAGYASICISPTGEVRPCETIVEDQFILGNILHQSIEDIATSHVAKFFQNIHFPKKEQCGGCKHSKSCQWCIADGIYRNRGFEKCRWYNEEISKFQEISGD